MEKAIRISLDDLAEDAFSWTIGDIDIGRDGHYTTVLEEKKEDLIKQLQKKAKEFVDSTASPAFYCPACNTIYEQDNGKEECDRCLGE